MTEFEIRVLYDSGLLAHYGEPAFGYDGPQHRLTFWQLVALSEGVYGG